jgi:hypothetical protein
MRSLVMSTALVAAMLLAGPVVAQQQQQQQLSGTGQFCLKGATGPIRCEYQTMAQCDQARPAGSADQCLSRSEAEGTVGVGTPAPKPPAK